jgi:cbb3-type cytochrome oxidase subunit 3
MQVIQFLQHYSVVFMFITFAVSMVLTFWPGRKQRFDHDGQIPLQDDR